MGPFVVAIDAIVLADESAPLMQRHTSMQLHRRRVAEQTHRCKYDRVRRYVNKHRRRWRETLIPLDHSPGERMACDFGEESRRRERREGAAAPGLHAGAGTRSLIDPHAQTIRAWWDAGDHNARSLH